MNKVTKHKTKNKSQEERFNAKTACEVRTVIKDIKKNGLKNMSPMFTTLEEMNAWLDK